MELRSPMSPFGDGFKNYFNTEDEDEDYDIEEGVPDNYDDEIECWPGLIDNVPNEFYNFVNNFYDAAEEKVKLTFCIWRKYSDPAWQIGNIDFSLLPSRYTDPDGSKHLLYFLDGKPETYLEWTNNSYRDEDEEQYFLDIDIVNYFFQLKPITQELLKKINPNLKLENVRKKFIKLGYPLLFKSINY